MSLCRREGRPTIGRGFCPRRESGEHTLRLQTFGGLRIKNGQVDAATAARRRPLALLALLAVAGERGLSREKVVAMLWPESDEEHGRNSLSHALSALRRDFGAQDLVTGGTELRLNADAITSDVEEFERSTARGERESATALYAGPFLDGFFLREAPDFERWAGEHRRRLHQLQVTALQRLAEEADERGDSDSAVTSWRRLATLEPGSPAAALGFMNALAAAGDRPAALRYFQLHESVLREDLGVDVEDAVISMAARLRGESGARPALSPPNDHVAVVTDVSSDGSRLALASGSAAAWASQQSGTESSANLTGNAVLSGRVAPWLALVILLALAGAAAGLNAFRQTDPRPFYNARQVTVAGFTNRTGDSTLDAFGFLAAEIITDALQRSGLVEVTDPGTSLLTVTGIRDRTARLDDAGETRLVGEATRAGLVVSGRYSREGDSLTIVARLSDVMQGKVIATAEAVRAHIGAPDSALDRLKQRVLGLLAVQLDDRLREVLPPGSTAQPTLPAYREYLDGMLRFQRAEYLAALPHFRRAYTLDSMFVAPLIWEIFACNNGNGGARCTELVRELSGHRAQLGPLDGYVLDYLEASEAHDFAGELAASEQASRLAPGSIWSYAFASSLANQGRFAEAVTAFDLIDRKYGWTRNWHEFWAFYSYVLDRVGDHRRQLEIVREGRRAIPGSLDLAYYEARARTATGTWAELDQLLATMGTLPDPGAFLGAYLQIVAKLLWTSSDTLHARQVRDDAIAWYRARPAASETTKNRVEFAMVLYDAGNCAEARSRLEHVLAELPRHSEALLVRALCDARFGERDAADLIISRLVAMADSDSRNFMRAARVAAVLGDRDRAVAFLKEYQDLGLYPLIDRAQMRDFASVVGYPPFVAVVTPR
jgi:DNA-binding SARP family transcriptional activator/tetratricopeptide (TPR) repeat protein/TolB-like protein